MIYTSSIFGPDGQDLILTSVTHLRKKAELKAVGSWRWGLGLGKGKYASLYTGSSVWDGLVVVWGVSVDTTILHTLLSAPACMSIHGILEGTRAWRYNYRDGEGDTAPEHFGIYSFKGHDRFDLFTHEGRIKAVMYMPCVNALVMS